MRNNLFDFKFLKLGNIDVRLQSLNSFFEDVITKKLEELENLKEDKMEVFEQIYFTSYNNGEGYYYYLHQEENNFLTWKKLKYEIRQNKGCDFFLNAGYVDCMEEAIRFLVEKENISPEHAVVKNLKAHLETSKEKILGAFFPTEYDLLWDDNEGEFNLIIGFDDLSKEKMIPEGEELLYKSSSKKDDILLAGYKECANEALNWLLNLGYEPGHPLIKSLAAHLTRKQAYLEKLNLEQFLINETYKYSEEEFDENEEIGPDLMESAYQICAYQIKRNTKIQTALVNAVFKGCDLQYSKNSL